MDSKAHATRGTAVYVESRAVREGAFLLDLQSNTRLEYLRSANRPAPDTNVLGRQHRRGFTIIETTLDSLGLAFMRLVEVRLVVRRGGSLGGRLLIGSRRAAAQAFSSK